MTDTLFTDLGDVMYLFDREIFKKEILKRTGKVPEKLDWSKSPILKYAFTGRINGRAYLEIRAQELGIKPNEMTEVWNKAVAPNEKYHEFLKEWKASGRKLYLLSNINVVAWNYYRRFPIFDIFDCKFLSYQLRCMKPSLKIFRICLERTGANPRNSIFVDDVKDNVEAAAKLGMATWLYRKETHDVFLDFVNLLLLDQ